MAHQVDEALEKQARSVARAFAFSYGKLQDLEDFEQEAWIGLNEAVSKYNGRTSIRDRVMHVVRYRLIDYIRRQGIITRNGSEPVRRIDITSMVDPHYLWRYVPRLKLPLEMELLAIWLYEGYSQREIAEGYGLTEGRVSQLVSKLRKIAAEQCCMS